MFDLKHAREESADGQGVHVSAAMGRHCAVLLERACDRIEYLEDALAQTDEEYKKERARLERENAALRAALQDVLQTTGPIETDESLEAWEKAIAALAPATSKEPT